MDEIGRVGWLTIGVTGMALAGAAHAVAGVGHIARDMLRSPAPEGSDAAPGGWFLFSALTVAGWAAYHGHVGHRGDREGDPAPVAPLTRPWAAVAAPPFPARSAGTGAGLSCCRSCCRWG
ncbi:hypothetical protein [Streptomyces sp. NRRL B-24484]|uniref:hypothetical protein n=1 Tax=Streptomyces sp. NRRL B-24484 TaxID=1463833 RepID=UPI00133142F6|nr:hypothetical protein [Streptomyces sp. NRRL B-24484]